MHPLGTNNPKAWPLVFPLFSGAPAQCREDEMKLDLLRFQKVQKSAVHIVRGAVTSFKPHGP